MEKREFDYDEPIIFCKHNFEISNAKEFATELANRFGININFIDGANSITDCIIIPDATTTKNLYRQSSNFENDFSYVLEFGDEAHCFYKNHIHYHLPFISNFSDFSNTSGIYEGISELKKFGADKVYIGNSNKLNISSEIKYDWDKLLNAILNSNHYIIEL